ncbi:hypothetical protein GCM10027299_21890 [Larkinella ripae]
MKALLTITAFLILGFFAAPDAKAQKVTKITAVTAATGIHVLEDTTGTGFYSPVAKGDVYIRVFGTGNTTKVGVYTKATDRLIWTGPLSTVYVLGAPAASVAAQTISQKLTYLKTHFPK